jgi:hypothetical protein
LPEAGSACQAGRSLFAPNRDNGGIGRSRALVDGVRPASDIQRAVEVSPHFPALRALLPPAQTPRIRFPIHRQHNPMRRTLLPICIAAALLPGCNAASPPPAPSAAVSFDTRTGVKELMGWMIDPSAGAIWGATGSEVTAEGTRDFAPTTDEEWNRLRTHAVTIAESGNLLILPGRARDQGDWIALSQAMTKTAHAVLEAIEAKDTQGLFDTGGELYQTCTDCHALYLIPAGPSQ